MRMAPGRSAASVERRAKTLRAVGQADEQQELEPPELRRRAVGELVRHGPNRPEEPSDLEPGPPWRTPRGGHAHTGAEDRHQVVGAPRIREPWARDREPAQAGACVKVRLEAVTGYPPARHER